MPQIGREETKKLFESHRKLEVKLLLTFFREVKLRDESLLRKSTIGPVTQTHLVFLNDMLHITKVDGPTRIV